EDLQAERLGVLATELEHVGDLDPARELERPGAVRRGVALAHLGGLDHAVTDEVAPGHQVEDVPALDVRTGDPPRPRDDPRVEEVPDGVLTAGVGPAQDTGTDVAPDELGVSREVGLLGRLDHGPRDGGLEALGVDLAVAGDPDRHDLALPLR